MNVIVFSSKVKLEIIDNTNGK